MSAVLPGVALVVAGTVLSAVLAWHLPLWWGRHVGRSFGITSFGPRAGARWREVGSIVLDPLSSLTTGNLVVTGVRTFDPDHERNLRWFAGALAHSYDDPVGRAVAKLAGRGRLSDVTTEPGRGICGSVDRHPVRVGEPSWIGISDEDGDEVGTTVAVEVDQRPLGRITVAEEVRQDASRQLDQLRRLGVTPVLASTAQEEAVARIAKLTASNVWHSATDPDQLARELAVSGTAVGVVRAVEDGAVLDVVAPAASTSTVRATIRTSTPGVDSVVHALRLTGRMFAARRRALWTVALLAAGLLPTAALGLLPWWGCGAAEVVAVLVIGIAASWSFMDVNPEDPDA